MDDGKRKNSTVRRIVGQLFNLLASFDGERFGCPADRWSFLPGKISN